MYAMGVALVSKTFSLDRVDKHLFFKRLSSVANGNVVFRARLLGPDLSPAVVWP